MILLPRPKLVAIAILIYAASATAFGADPAVHAAPCLQEQGIDEVVASIKEKSDSAKAPLFKQLTAFGNIESFRALKILCKPIESPSVLRQAFFACESYRGKGEAQTAAIKWINGYSNDKNATLRQGSVQALVRFGKEASPELNALLRRSEDAVVRAWTLRPLLGELMQRGTPVALKQILENMRLGHSGSRETITGTLAMFEGEGNDTVFLGVLRDRDAQPTIKIVIMEAIGLRDASGLDKVLLGLFKRDPPAVQLAAIATLDERGEGVHDSKLRKLLKSEHNQVRRQAVISLAKIHGNEPNWFEELEGYARHKDPEVRMGAAVALAELRTPEALQLLYILMVDPDHLVQRESLQQIGNLRRKDTLPALFQRINGARGRNRLQVLVTLRLITGLDHGTSARRWQNWWNAEGEAFVVPPYEEALKAEQERITRRKENSTVSTFFGLQVVSDRVCFILDVSGSMEQLTGKLKRIDAAKNQLTGVLKKYPTGDLFNVIFFASDTNAWAEGLVKMDEGARKDVLRYIERQNAGGGTAIYDGLLLAFEDRRIDTIFLLTDGDPGGGTIDNPDLIRAAVKRWNDSRHIRINCIAIGKDSTLLKNLASDSGGAYHKED